MQGTRQKRIQERPKLEVIRAKRNDSTQPRPGFYRTAATQRVVALLVFAIALGVQYRLVNAPVSQLADTHMFSPAIVRAAESVVSFIDPETDPGQFTFGYDQPAGSGQQKMIVDAYFEKASLSDETLRRLAALGVLAPSESAPISYVTDVPKSAGCSTGFQIEVPAGGNGTRAIQFSQSEAAPSDRHRLLEVKMVGADSTVTLKSGGSFAPDGMAQCHVDLRVGDWVQPNHGFLPVKLTVPASSGFRFRWEAADIKPAGWPSEGGAVSLLRFGSHRLERFHAGGIGILRAGTLDPFLTQSGLAVRSERRQFPLAVESLRIGTGKLELQVEGRGRTLQDGKLISRTDVLGAIMKYPLLALLLGATNAALVDWLRRVVFSSSKKLDSAGE
jgi:hypothetical protein